MIIEPHKVEHAVHNVENDLSGDGGAVFQSGFCRDGYTDGNIAEGLWWFKVIAIVKGDDIGRPFMAEKVFIYPLNPLFVDQKNRQVLLRRHLTFEFAQG